MGCTAYRVVEFVFSDVKFGVGLVKPLRRGPHLN